MCLGQSANVGEDHPPSLGDRVTVVAKKEPQQKGDSVLESRVLFCWTSPPVDVCTVEPQGGCLFYFY